MEPQLQSGNVIALFLGKNIKGDIQTSQIDLASEGFCGQTTYAQSFMIRTLKPVMAGVLDKLSHYG